MKIRNFKHHFIENSVPKISQVVIKPFSQAFDQVNSLTLQGGGNNFKPEAGSLLISIVTPL